MHRRESRALRDLRPAARPLAAALAAAFALGTSAMARPADAATPASKEECVDAHGRGQDMRDRALLTRAHSLFLMCSQSACPSLIQGDCARFAEEVERLVPSVAFAARDAHAGDLANTSVYVDEVLVASQLDDGKSYEVDPGRHVVRFVHGSKETTLNVVLNQGEKGRTLLATFVDERPPAPVKLDDPPPVAAKSSRSALPLVVAGFGGAALATGAGLFAYGLQKIPDSCSVSQHDCAAAPGSATFDDASRGASTANIGIAVGIGGAVALVGGLVWYFVQPTTTTPAVGARVSPWLAGSARGLDVRF